MYVKNVSLLSLTRCTLYIIPIITSLESALCYENCLLCKAVWFVSYVSAWKWKDCQSWMENCFNFDLWHSEHLLVQFIPPPPTSVEKPKGQRPESYSICDTDSSSQFFQGSRRGKQTNLRKQGHHNCSQQQRGASK